MKSENFPETNRRGKMYGKKAQLTPGKRKQLSRRSGETPNKQPRKHHDGHRNGKKLFSSQQSREGTPRRSQRTKRRNVSYVDKNSSSSEEDVDDEDNDVTNKRKENKADDVAKENDDERMKDGGVEKMVVDANSSVEIEEFSDKSSLGIDEDFRDFDAE